MCPEHAAHCTEFGPSGFVRSPLPERLHGPAFTDLGGLLVVGAEVVLAGAANSASGNTVVVRLWGSKITGNQEFDFHAFGARSSSKPLGLAGTHNHALVELHGVSRFVDIMTVDSEPADPQGTNTVTVVDRQ